MLGSAESRVSHVSLGSSREEAPRREAGQAWTRGLETLRAPPQLAEERWDQRAQAASF